MWEEKDSFSISIVDTVDHNCAEAVVNHSLTLLDNKLCVQKVYWYSDRPPSLLAAPGVWQWIKIEPIKQMPFDYNHCLLNIMPHVATQQWNLVIQTDGYPCNWPGWTDEFLEYDYIGAVWPWEQQSVGNGGFSLRSRRLLDALLALDWTEWKHHPEDAVIGRHCRHQLETQGQVRFAPPELADRFSIEWNMSSPWMGKSFGFHGKHPEIRAVYPPVT